MEKKDNKKAKTQDLVPYLHELTDNPNYEIKTLISEDSQVTNPNDYHATYHLLFYDKKEKNSL